MTLAEARRIAKEFHADYVATDRQWAISSLESYLPANHVLRNAQDDDFFPATVEHIAQVLRRCVVRITPNA